MRTTVRLDQGLLNRARREAARRGITLTALIEQGLRLALRRPSARIALPMSRAGGGLIPGVDLDDTSALLDRMDDRARSSRTSTS
jgi:hypothetical protein